ncbi:MAG: TonB-dependent receptor plug domain-containing protein [Clostridia bacterium]|nr:TonB-dependent receptor plug domain-containing protein [Clostridia bacterium]
MKKIISFIVLLFISLSAIGQTFNYADTNSVKYDVLDSVSVVSFYRNTVNIGSLMNHADLVSENYGQEPSHLFRKMPGIFSMNDNGTEFGYGYFRIRGLDQTRINVTLDGMPWNEAEDYGTYFANSPDLLSSIHTVKVERGTSSTNNGTASSGGSINLESIDLLKDTESYGYVGAGSFNTYKTSIVYNSGLFGKNAIHIKATQQQTDGYRDWSFNNSQAFTVKYGYFFNNKHSIDFMSLNGRHRNGQGWIGNTLNELTINPRANGDSPDDIDEWFQSINKIQYKGWLKDNILFTSSAYIQYQTGWYNMDLDNYMIKFEDPTWDKTNIVYSYGLTHYLYGANAAAKFYLNNLTLTAGTNIYKYQREHYMNDIVASHFKNVDPSEYYDNTGYKNDGNVFLSANYKLNKFNFGANVQYRYVDFNYVDHLNSDVIYNKNDAGTVWNFINYGFNVDYNLDNANKFYVRYAEVSREPTRTDMFGGNEFYPGELTTTKAERSYDVEGGYVIATNKIEANVNLYYMYFKNERILTGEYGLNGLPLHDTANNSYRTGIEVSVDWNFAGGFHYALNGSASKNIVNSENFVNKYHILTPAYTLNNDLYYKNNNMKIGVNNLYHSKMYLDQNNEMEIPYHLTFNLYGNYRWRNIEFGARVNNLLNKVNYYNCAVGATDLLWFRDAGTNFFIDLKFYF